MAWTVSSVRVRAPRIALCLILGCLSLVSLPSRAIAQTVSPQIVEFDPSADHNRHRQWCRRRRRLRAPLLHRRRQPAAARDRDRQAGPAVRRKDPIQLHVAPGRLASRRRRLRGPRGCGRSRRIDGEHHLESVRVSGHDAPAAAPCTYTLSQTARTVAAAATTGSVSVTAGSGCAWTAASSGSWLTITSGASGTANGTINYSVSANPSASARSATLTVGYAAFTLTQSAPCTYALSPASRTIGTTAATGSVGVTAGSGCAWTAASSGSWLTITGSPSGTSNGTVSYSAPPTPDRRRDRRR